MHKLSRREWMGIAAAGAAVSRGLAARPQGPLVETSIHLFAADQTRFPYHRNATYRPPAKALEEYAAFVRQAKLDHTVIVHSEVYQDDHSYLEYCFEREPWPRYFKGTCLFDPIDPRTPQRIRDLTRRLPARIVAIRIHEMQVCSLPPTSTGPMRDRDMRSAGMRNTWRAMHDLGLAVQMQSIPCYAPLVGALAAEFREMPVLIDHLGLPSRGTPQEFEDVLRLSRHPRVYMKISSLNLPSHQAYPYSDVKPLVRRLFDAFGVDRLIWGGLGMSMPAFEKATALIDQTFDYASAADRMKIRGGNAMKLFGFPVAHGS